MSTPKPIVGIHLDLKYQIPSKSYLNQWVQTLPAMGINTLLIEYEDKFPFKKYPFLQAKEAFTPAELTLFLDTARKAGLQIVPLIQTLSHLEFALGHEQLAHLRETPDTPTLMDISNPEAIAFVKDLLDEVLAFHQPDALFHLGGDEAWHIGLNERSAAILKERGLLDTWVQHINQYVDHIEQAKKRAIVWDDIFWKFNAEEIKNCGLRRTAMLHCWSYGAQSNEKGLASLSRRVGSYQDAGFTTIGAPCFNWGIGTPRHIHCLENTRAWAITSDKLPMAGMINTAWSCFHVMPHACTIQIAGTGKMMTDQDKTTSDQWQEEFMGRHFGCDASGFSQAMQKMDAFWELDVKLGRPITVILYGNMDMILSYGSQEIRMQRGAYPIGFDTVDFDDVFRQKFALMKSANDDRSVSNKLQAYHTELTAAAATFKSLATQATANVPEAKYLAFTAKIKQVYTELLQELLDSGKPAAATVDRWQQLGDAFAGIMLPFMEEYSATQMKRMWWQPMASFLSQGPGSASSAGSSKSKDMLVG